MHQQLPTTSADHRSHPVLLAHLDFTTATMMSPLAGDSFTISTAAYDPSNPLTYDFADSGYNPIPFTVNPGTVTITSADVAGVPEPSSLLLLTAGLGFGWYRTRRAQKQTVTEAELH